MINLNGIINKKSKLLFDYNNRAFKYGDALFETLKVKNLQVYFLEDHYFRLMASMRMLRMKIPMRFTLEYFENEIINLVKQNNLDSARVRFTIFRKSGGFYEPKTNEINYLIEATQLISVQQLNYKVDLFKDYFVYSGLLSTIKTTNKITNVLASIFASENELDNCILLNEKKHIVEVINGNIFLVKGNVIKTPPISEGCIKGVCRKKIIEIIATTHKYKLEETAISPFELLKADEVFITNAIIGIQPVTVYKKCNFTTQVSKELAIEFAKLI
ncbi:aminotransferase class IV [Lutibacter profundi]|uniref:branched-chain-amino-acid transaminase n=1 Tax=Lutibacter profundi TaxID=1622118 RepID=A0A120IDX5_9FLAO|nr:aminotransferase class IV [Lutibacter profundi]AMC09894.1 aminotransferase class IV [Lutibacter profundi]